MMKAIVSFAVGLISNILGSIIGNCIYEYLTK